MDHRAIPMPPRSPTKPIDQTDDRSVQAEWKSLFSFTSRSNVSPLILGLGLAIASGLLTPAFSILLGKVFDSFAAYGAGNIEGQDLVGRVSMDGLYLLALGMASWFLNGTYFMFWFIFGELQAKSARNQLYEAMLVKDMEWFDMRKDGVSALLSRLQTQIGDLQLATSQPLGFAVQYTVTMVAALGVAFYFAWDLTLVTLSTLPVGAIILAWLSAKMQPAIERQASHLTRASKLASNAISGIDTVKCCNGQEQEVRKYYDIIKQAAQHYIVQVRLNALQIGFVRLLTLSMFVQGFWYGSHLIDNGSKSSGQILTGFWACLMATQTFEQILPQLIVLEKGRAAGAKLKGILYRMENGRQVVKMAGRKTPAFCEGDILVKNVSFSYPSRAELALNNASFFFPAREMTFVVGRSGSGKSTLSNLLLQFYQPSAGIISIDGEPIQTLDVNWLRNNITLVQQASVLFNETIFRNIAFGRRAHGDVTHSDLRACIDLAALADTIRALPKGLDTLVGTGGSKVSGGQRQRIALARARLRDTPILILDEATSALDHISRISIMAAIRKWRVGQTTIVITHNISQILGGDFVYAMDHGKIVEEGYRQALEANVGGLFANLAKPGTEYSKPLPESPKDIQGSSDRQNSPRPSEDSMDIRVRMKQVQPHPNRSEPEKYKMKRLPHISSALPPMSAYNQLSTARLSVVPTRSHASKARVPRSELQIELTELPDPPLSLLPPSSPPKPLPPPVPVTLAPPIARPQRTVSLRSRSKIVSGESIGSPGTGSPSLLDIDIPSPHLTQNEDARQVMSLKRIMLTIWPGLTRDERMVLAGGFFFSVIHGASTPVFSWVFSRLLATFFTPVGRAQAALVWSLSVFGVAVVDATASFMMHYLLEQCGQAWIDGLRTTAMRALMDQPKSWFDHDKNSLTKIANCLDRNAEEMRNLLGRFAGFVVVAITMMSISFVWSMIICWKLTLVALSTAPIIYGITRTFQAISGHWEHQSNEAGEAVAVILNETFVNIRIVRALTLESRLHKKYHKSTRKARKIGFMRAAYSGLFFGVSDGSIIFITALLFWYGAILTSSHQFGVEDVITVFTMLLFTIANANAIVAFIPQVNSSRDTATRLLQLSSLPLGQSHEHSGRIRLQSPGQIKFDRLTFLYPTRPQPILSTFSLSLPTSGTLALVGPSGSGKTTIAALLLGLYDVPRSGPPIMIGKHSLSTLHLPTWRTMISLVPQSPTIFPDSVMENIIYGLPSSSSFRLQAHVRAAAIAVGLDDLITSLPAGYETLLGDGGIGLSGGQVQRLGIARAIVRKPKILIMDEPTSNLDAVSAEGIRHLVYKMGCEGVMVLVITHSQEMMRACGRCVVMKEGSVVEEGSYADLMARRGELWRLIGGVGR